MKRIKLSWKNKGVTIIWPDHPLVIAGNEVLEKIVSQIESKVNNTTIADYLVTEFNVTECEAMEYVESIFTALQQSGVLEDNQKKLDSSNEYSPDQNNLAMATLNITKKCNLKCLHCYAGEGTKSEEMTKEEIERAVISLGSSIIREPKLLILSGGEPTLEKDKLKIAIETAVKFGLNLRLNTNGHGIDESLAKYLSEKQVLVQVSLDGPNEQINSLLRGSKNAFMEAISAIKKLVSANCRTRISCTIHSENVKEIPAMIDLAQNLGVEQFTTSSLVSIGNALQNNLKPVEYKKEFEILYEAVKASVERQKMTKSTLFAETINAIRAGIRFTYCGTGACTCCIDSDGSLYPCINMARDKYLVGNIMISEFSTMWEESQILRELRNLNVDTLNQKCSKCDFRYFCGGYCRGETIESGKSVMSPYIRCSEWKRGIIKILSILSESPDIYCLGEDPYKGVMHRE